MEPFTIENSDDRITVFIIENSDDRITVRDLTNRYSASALTNGH